MTKLSTANLLSIHVLILRIFVFGGATRIVGAGSRQSQIGLSKGVLSANPLPGASGLGKLTSNPLSVVPLAMFGEKNDSICFLRTFFTTEASTGREPPKKGRRGKRENGYNCHF